MQCLSFTGGAEHNEAAQLSQFTTALQVGNVNRKSSFRDNVKAP